MPNPFRAIPFAGEARPGSGRSQDDARRPDARGRRSKPATMMGHRLLAPVIVGCAIIGFAAPASATSPDRFSFSDSGSEQAVVQCDGFAIDSETTQTFDVTVLFDASGQVIKVISRGRIIETNTNSVTGKSVMNRGVFQDFYTHVDGTDEFTHAVVGFDFMATSPGEGVVLQDVGRKVYSTDGEHIVFLAGQHRIPDGPAAEAVFCAALS
jgi:hypothetical protein